MITVAIPAFNEADNLDRLLDRLLVVLGRMTSDWEIIIVDDGSTDNTRKIIRNYNKKINRIKGLSLSRNFGQESALCAGLRHAVGDAVVLMDADLQHPPEVIEEFVARWKEGYEVVYGQRIDQGSAPWLRKLASFWYYKIFEAISGTPLLRAEGMGDFWLLDRKAVTELNRMDEVARFTKGLCSWVGFRSVGVPYRVSERISGRSKWGYRQLVGHALNGLTSFSTVPLRLSTLMGLILSAAAVCYSLVVLAQTLILGRDSPGFPTLAISIMLIGGAQLTFLGILGEYLGRVYEEVKRRPLFIVAEKIGIQGAPLASEAHVRPQANDAGAKS